MKRTRWPGPSPALVIACLALFVALGGTVLAATKIDGRRIRVKSLPGNRLRVKSLPGNRLAVRSLPGNRVRVGSLPGNRLRKGTIPGNRIAPRSLRGAQIDVGTLGKVPDAAHADAADAAGHAQTATAADHAADATTVNGHAVGCVVGQRQFAGACWDLASSTTQVNALKAASACAARGGELPDLLQLLIFDRQPGVAVQPAGEWTSSEEPGGVETWAIAVVEGGARIRVVGPNFQYHYRCVTPFLG